MTSLEVLDWLMLVPQLILSLGFWLFPVLLVVFGIGSVARYMLWPALCSFGNWLGRES